MKLRDLVAHLKEHGAELLRKSTAVPRHREINDFLCRKICKDLDIPPPSHS